MGEGVRGLMGTGRSRVEFEDCGVGRVNLECAWHVFGVWATQAVDGRGVEKSSLVPAKVVRTKGPTLYGFVQGGIFCLWRFQTQNMN